MSNKSLLQKSLRTLRERGVFGVVDAGLGPGGYIHRQIQKQYFKTRMDENKQSHSKLLAAATFGYLLIFENWKLLRETDYSILCLPEFDGIWHTRELPSLDLISRVPTLLDANHGTYQHRENQRRKYTLKGFVEFEPDDVVFDIGAYVGGLALEIAPVVDTVIAVDPFARIDSSLQSNVCEYDNVTVVPCAAWNDNTTLDLNLSMRPNDSSVLAVDAFDLGTSQKVPAVTVPTLATKHGINHIDFLKIEAEGAEIEILEGVLFSPVTVDKLAIDYAPERAGESPRTELVRMLSTNGYRVKDHPDFRVLFAIPIDQS